MRRKYKGLTRTALLSIESFVAQQAFYRYSFVAVPIHDLRNKDLLIDVANQTKMKVLVATHKVLPLLLPALKECPSIKTVIVIGIYISEEQKAEAAKLNVKLLKFADMEYQGASNPLPAVKPDPEDLAMINYNTKSTSLSKGVMLTHANLVAAMTAFNLSLPGPKKLTSKDRLLSHFSNGDVIAVWMNSAIILAGGSIVFPSGLMKNVLYDAQATAPTVFARYEAQPKEVIKAGFLYVARTHSFRLNVATLTAHQLFWKRSRRRFS